MLNRYVYIVRDADKRWLVLGSSFIYKRPLTERVLCPKVHRLAGWGRPKAQAWNGFNGRQFCISFNRIRGYTRKLLEFMIRDRLEKIFALNMHNVPCDVIRKKDITQLTLL